MGQALEISFITHENVSEAHSRTSGVTQTHRHIQGVGELLCCLLVILALPRRSGQLQQRLEPVREAELRRPEQLVAGLDRLCDLA